MCGLIGGELGLDIEAGLAACRHRGPDAEGVLQVDGYLLGHTRLAIQDLDTRSNQPFTRGSVSLVFAGEIWNQAALREQLAGLYRQEFRTTGDTEVLAAALDCMDEEALRRAEGMFALAWWDGEKLRLARDRFGEVPMYWSRRPFAFATERKALIAAGVPAQVIQEVPPGRIVEVSSRRASCYYSLPTCRSKHSLEEAAPRVLSLLEAGVRERLISDVPLCVLLSGGVDSAAITAIASRELPGLVAYTAVMDGKSPDLRAARQVAEALGVELREVQVQEPTAEDLAGVVAAIEQPSKVQVEIGWACLALARRLREDGYRVVLSGEGSDELWASYGLSYHAIQRYGFRGARERYVSGESDRNFARCNKVFLAHGVECRLPFLHRPLVEYALSLSQEAVGTRSKPKLVLQRAVEDLLPGAVVSRPKAAFQDALGLKAAAARAVAKPAAFYGAEYRRLYG